MTSYLKRSLCLIIAVVTAFTATACNPGSLNKKGNGKGVEYADLTYSFKSKELPMPDFIHGIYNINYSNGKIYFSGYYEETKANSEYVYEERFGVMQEDGTGIKQIILPKTSQTADGYLSQPYFDNQGNIWYLETVTAQSEAPLVPDDGGNQIMPRDLVIEKEYEESFFEKFYMHKLDCDGNEIFVKEIVSPSEDGYFYVGSMSFDNDGNIYIPFETNILIYDSDLEPVGKIEHDSYIDTFTISSKTGKGYIRYWNEKGNTTKEVDLALKKVLPDELAPLNGDFRYSPFIPGDKGNDFYINNRLSVYSYNVGGQPELFLNWIDSDVDPNNISSVAIISPEKVIYSTQNWDQELERSVSTLNLLTKRTQDELKPKIRLVYGALYVDYYVQKAIIDFNKKNDDYRIQIVDYSTYNSDEDYEAGAKQLNNDIIAGNMPDILQISNSSIPFDSYVAKGLFADLYPLMEKDPSINTENFFENILKAFEHNGKLYEIAPTFTIQTVVGKKSIFGDSGSVSVERINEILNTMPEGTEVFGDMTKSNVLMNSLYLIGSNFIDKNTGTCTFDSNEFIELLEFSNSFPETIDTSKYDDEAYWEEYERMYRNNKALLMQTGVYSPDSLHYVEKVQFGEQVSFVGYPVANGMSGSSIIPNLELSISSKSKAIDGAWEFVKYFLSDDYYQTQNYGLTLSKAQFEKAAQKAMTPRTYIDENGVEVVDKNTYYFEGEELDIGYPTQEQIDRIRSFIESVTTVGRFDQNLTDIINEEAEYYFKGQKTASDVASVIQSKAFIYINESR